MWWVGMGVDIGGREMRMRGDEEEGEMSRRGDEEEGG